jgi:putative MATE family efflux protein
VSHAPTGLFRLAWPIFAEQLLHILTNVIATLMVSRIGDAAVGGVGSAGQVIWMLMMAFGVLAVGASTVVTHHLGLQDAPGALRLAKVAVASNLWIGAVFSLLLLPAAPWLLHGLQLPPGPYAHALPYLQWMGGTLFLESMNFGLSAVLRAHGHTREVMLVMLGQNVVNAAGIALVVFQWDHLSTTGVALATVASRALACVALWWLARRIIGLRLQARDLLGARWADLKRLLGLGVPAMLSNMSWFGAFMFITALSARMGEQTLAAQNYVMQVAGLVILFAISIGLGHEILLGRLVGAGRLDEARRQCLLHMKIGLGLALAVSALVALLAPALMAVFTDDPGIRRVGATLLAMGLLLETGRSFNLILGCALRACGDTRFALRVGLVSHWGVMALGGWWLGTRLGLGLPGVWLAFIADEWLRGLLMLRRWRQGRWEHHARRAAAAAAAQPA